MLNVKLEDFQNHKNELYEYASCLLRGRGFVEKTGELKEFANDVVQNVYLRWHKCYMDGFVTVNHLSSFLRSLVYKEFLNTIDINRRGAQYILLKKSDIDEMYKQEFKGMNVRRFTKPDQEQFDVITSFKTVLDEEEIIMLDYLLEGYSKADIHKKTDIPATNIARVVNRIREKHIKYASTNS